MLKEVILATDSLDPTTWEKVEVENVADFLMERYPEGLPHSARIYLETVSEATDVTPFDELGVEKLIEMEGTFYVVIYPEVTIPVWLVWVAVGLQVAFAVYMYSKIPNASQRNLHQSSPNNNIAGRTNTARLGARVPAIYGTVQATPDLLSNYMVYESNKQVEYSYMCLGEGYYQVDAAKVFDGTTPYQNIDGNYLDLYAPFTSPNYGSPQLTIGGHISEPIKIVVRDNAVNGQTLLAPNQGSYAGTGTIGYSSTGVISYNGLPDGSTGTSTPPNFTGLFTVGSNLKLTNSPLDGVYVVKAVSELSITLDHPELVNPAWSTIDLTHSNGTVETYGFAWVGSFIISGGANSEVWFNMACLSGLYADDGNNQFAIATEVMVGITPLNQAGNPIGSEIITNQIIYGNAVDRDMKAITIKIAPPIKGTYYKVRAAKYSAKNTAFKGQIVDEIKWQDVYSVKPVAQTDFGNVTTIRTRTVATNQSTALKERKLNLIVTRKLPKWLGGTSFSTELYPTNNAADIISAIALDKTFGNRSVNEIDFDNIYSVAGTTGSVASYFGSPLTCEFCYTFDNSNVTFEEAFGMIAGAVFCTAFRRGSKLKLLFEKKTADSTMLFNHRNKLPNTEQRSVRFGNEKNYDSLQYQWVSPTTQDNLQGKGGDSLDTYYMPDEYYKPLAVYSAPNKIQSAGVRNKLQAYFQAHRIWNKIKYQNLSVEFTATHEADILVPTERILVADNTRADTQDGEVRYQTSLLLGLSQPVKWLTPTMTIFLQMYDGSVDSISVTKGAGSEDNEVLLSHAPRLPLVLEDDAFATTTYMLVSNADTKSKAFLVTERSPASDLTTKVSAVNYDDRFYDNDSDYKNGIVDINGNLL